MKKLIVITGQTATGKTSLAVRYAEKLNGELINCDSRQIYKKLDIVTGKDRSIIKKIPIWLYDVADPKEYFSSYQYAQKAERAIKDVVKKGKTPIIVGGTYFYLKHLLYGIDTHGEPDWKLRKKLDFKSAGELQKMLVSLNPESFKLMNESDRKNPRRLMRKIELAHSKKTVKKVREKSLIDKYKVEIIGLRFKKEEQLRKQVVKRVKERLKDGAVEEVKKLLKDGYSEQDPGLKTIGYKQLIPFVKGKISKEKAMEAWIVNETQYAKHQYVFMKKDENIKWKTID